MKSRFAVLIVICLAILVPLFALAEPATVSVVKLRAWLDSDDPPLVLDVRGREAYQSGTLPGAFNAGRDPNGYLPGNSKEPAVLIVPDTADNEFMKSWSRRLTDSGHEVWVLDTGFEGWKEAGGDIETSNVTYTKPGRVPFIIPRGLCEGNDPAHTFE